MSEIPKGKNHTLMLDARGKLMLTGAEDVSGFNEETVSVLTSCGRLIIKGERLHIDKLNLESGEVSIDGKPVKLTPIEYKILLLLAKNPGRVFSAEEIYERVWQEKAINTDTIMVHVRNIREKIELDPKNPKYLKVVWGVGYKIEKQQ